MRAPAICDDLGERFAGLMRPPPSARSSISLASAPTIRGSSARAVASSFADLAVSLHHDLGGASLGGSDDRGGFFAGLDASARDRLVGFAARRGTALLGLPAQRLRVVVELLDVVLQPVDVRPAPRDRRPDGLEEDRVEDRQEDDEVDDLNQERSVERQHQACVLGAEVFTVPRAGSG